MAKNTDLYVIDGTALLFRNYYGRPPREAEDGTEVNGVVGTSQRLQQIMRTRRPHHVLFVFDAGKKNYRHEIDENYKANRGEPPEDLVPQFDLVKNLVEVLGFCALSLVGWEADDLMATGARLGREAGLNTFLISSDKDLYQLVEDSKPFCRIFDSFKEEEYTASSIERLTGVRPDQIVDYMSLTGDSTDNVAGVKGVGPKAAAALIQHFGTLDEIYMNLEKVADLSVRGAAGIQKKLAAGKDMAYLAKKLVVLDVKAQVNLTAANIAERTLWRGPREDADDFFEWLKFKGTIGPLRQLADELNP